MLVEQSDARPESYHATPGTSKGELPWHERSVQAILDVLHVDADFGLDSTEAVRRLRETGPNELRVERRQGPLVILGRQFTSLMMLILIGAALVSLVMGDTA